MPCSHCNAPPASFYLDPDGDRVCRICGRLAAVSPEHDVDREMLDLAREWTETARAASDREAKRIREFTLAGLRADDRPPIQEADRNLSEKKKRTLPDRRRSHVRNANGYASCGIESRARNNHRPLLFADTPENASCLSCRRLHDAKPSMTTPPQPKRHLPSDAAKWLARCGLGSQSHPAAFARTPADVDCQRCNAGWTYNASPPAPKTEIDFSAGIFPYPIAAIVVSRPTASKRAHAPPVRKPTSPIVIAAD